MKEQPLVSVICLVFNHGKYLRQCLDGFVCQKTSFPFEIIIHDDASTDNSQEIIKEYVAKYPNLFVPILQTENQYSKGVRIGFTFMYPKARGKYIAECEGDDYWTDPLKLQKQVDAMEIHPECTICFHRVQTVDVSGHKCGEMMPKHLFHEGCLSLGDYTFSEFSFAQWTFQTSCFFFKKSLLKGYKCLMEKDFKCFPFGDMPLVLYCLMNGKGYFIDSRSSCYRVMSGGYNSMLQADQKKARAEYLKLQSALQTFDDLTQRKYHQDVNNKLYVLQMMIDGQKPKKYKLRRIYWRLMWNFLHQK